MRELLRPTAGETQGRRILTERISPSSGWFCQAGRTLYRGKTAFQEIELVETEEFGATLLLDGAIQVMESSEFQYHEPLAHGALLSHPDPRRVLIIGGGDGGLLREVLRHRCVQAVDFVELDEEVVAFSRKHLATLNDGAFDDGRTRTFFTDGRAFVEAALARKGKKEPDSDGYDAVLMDMTDPAGPSLMLYTAEFFRAVRGILRDGRGVFAMHSESPETRPAAFARIRRTLSSVFPTVRGAYSYIRMYGTLWSFAVASVDTDPITLPPETVSNRIQDRGLDSLRLVSGKSWPALFASWPYIDALVEEGGPISTDDDPDFPDAFDPHADSLFHE